MLRREAFFGGILVNVVDPAAHFLWSVQKNDVGTLGPDRMVVGDIREEAKLCESVLDPRTSPLATPPSRCREDRWGASIRSRGGSGGER
jgi:hypothetical protein